MQMSKAGAGWLGAVIMGLGLTTVTPAQAQDKQYFPLLVYRTGPYAANGAQLANGMIDYLKLINAKGGVNGVMLSWEECETEYKTDVGVECYERLKGNGAVAAVSPFSTGITYALIEKTAADENVLFSMGYGRTSAAEA
jgi:branched-chain amino acid transport system substrate-binding protein